MSLKGQNYFRVSGKYNLWKSKDLSLDDNSMHQESVNFSQVIFTSLNLFEVRVEKVDSRFYWEVLSVEKSGGIDRWYDYPGLFAPEGYKQGGFPPLYFR